MKDFGSLFAAYLLAWAIFFGYQAIVGRRLARLSDDLERLKEAVRRGES